MTTASSLPQVISVEQTSEEQFLRQIFVRDQMADWSKSPFIMAKADGVYYWDTNGKKYLDALSGIYVVSVGHNNRRVIDAIHKQLDELHFSPPMHGTNPVAIQLANLLSEIGPKYQSDTHQGWTVKFQCGGSEVTEAAIKLARQYHRLTGNPGKYKVISRYLSWHGSTMASLSASGLKGRKTVNEPLAPGFIHVFPPTCYRCPFKKNYPECEITCATLIEDVINMEDASTVAAIMVEPIGHTGGIIDPPEEYLPILRELCDRHNILLIFDEIITGIGRTGHMFAAETFGVTPDILCIAKGMSGGYLPISAMMCRRSIADVFWGDIADNPGFVEGHTFEGSPLACASGLAVLQEILERDLCANARREGKRLHDGMIKLQKKYEVIGDIRGKGLFLGMEFVKDRATKKPFGRGEEIGIHIGKKALELGLLCRFDPHWIAFGPPLCVESSHIDELLSIIDLSIAAVIGK